MQHHIKFILKNPFYAKKKEKNTNFWRNFIFNDKLCVAEVQTEIQFYPDVISHDSDISSSQHS